jgi:hypothetical protein
VEKQVTRTGNRKKDRKWRISRIQIWRPSFFAIVLDENFIFLLKADLSFFFCYLRSARLWISECLNNVVVVAKSGMED